MPNEELTRLYSDCEDESDPACMEKILSYLERIEAEDEEFMELLTDALNGVVISWPQPWYQRSRSLTRSFKETVKNGEETFRTDKITHDESSAIDNNWKKLIKRYDIPDKPQCFSRWRQKDHRIKQPTVPSQVARHYVISYISRGIKRTLPQVYYHFISKHAFSTKGAYSYIEERIMNVCFKHEPKKAVVYLSNILGRESRGIYNKYYISQGFQPVRQRQKWTLQLASKFLGCLLNHTNRPLKKLRNREIDREIWMKIQDDMEIPYYNLRYFWLLKLHAQLFIKEEVKLKSIRKRTYKMLKKSDYKIWTDIRWNELVKLFPKGYTSKFLHYIAVKFIRRTNREFLKQPLRDVMMTALKKLKECRRNYLLKHLEVNDKGNLEIVPIGR